MATVAYPAPLPEFSQTFGMYGANSVIMQDTEATFQDLAESSVDLQLAAVIRESIQSGNEFSDPTYSAPLEYTFSEQFRVIGTSEDRVVDDSCVPITDMQIPPEMFKWIDRVEMSNISNITIDDDDDKSVELEFELPFLDDVPVDCNSDGENSFRSNSSRDDTPSPNSIDSSDYSPRLPDFDYICNKPKHFDFEDDTDEEEFEKPYCKSRRGAKNVLLWKFILQVLENRADLAKWVNRREGTFKFVDTTTMSRMWGEKKRKRDMTFEKLSRGIRHYYKSGLMSRIEGTRLVYKFNWPQVPKPFRKN